MRIGYRLFFSADPRLARPFLWPEGYSYTLAVRDETAHRLTVGFMMIEYMLTIAPRPADPP
jgi:hypothetical protein